MHRQIPFLNKKRYLCRALNHNGMHRGLTFVEIAEGKATLKPFAGETHSTSYVDSISLTTDAENRILNIEIK